jgi:hypothetical protein
LIQGIFNWNQDKGLSKIGLKRIDMKQYLRNNKETYINISYITQKGKASWQYMAGSLQNEKENPKKQTRGIATAPREE